MKLEILRQQVKETLDNESAKYFILANSVIGLVAIVSIILALTELISYFHRYENMLYLIDLVTTIFFTLEYALRFWAADQRWSYVRSPLGLIDLASFVPTYLGFGNFGFLKTARFIRIARLSRVTNLTNASRVMKKKE